MTIVGKLKISPHVEKFQMSPHDRCEESENLRKWHVCDEENVVIYAKFMQFLRAFIWRKIEPKSTLVEKNDKYEV